MDAIMLPRNDLWTDDNKKIVRDYWMQGYSALWIGTKLGKTRRSIMGLVWRMGLMRVERPANPSPMSHGENRGTVGRKPVQPVLRKPLRAIMGAKRSDGELVSLDSVPMPEPSVAAKTSYRIGGKITMEHLKHNSCRWPIGDPQKSDFGYCGAKTDGISPYCTIHKKVAFYNPRSSGHFRTPGFKPR
jgi:GcrA cell cycle regulator